MPLSLATSALLTLFQLSSVSAAEKESADKPTKTSSEHSKPEPVRGTQANRLETSGVPVFGYDSNTGVEFGGLVNFAKFRRNYFPYEWRLRAWARLSLKGTPNGVVTPLHDHGIDLDYTGLGAGPGKVGELRLRTRLGFEKNSQAGYYGMGAGSLRDDSRVAAQYNAYFYNSVAPYTWLLMRLAVWRKIQETPI
ncbi:MAG: hypothetical protein MK135_05195, partial [Polyangiaceae bacterium]|nr:hypothetical protein [Polyangiaceae bacterium]